MGLKDVGKEEFVYLEGYVAKPPMWMPTQEELNYAKVDAEFTANVLDHFADSCKYAAMNGKARILTYKPERVPFKKRIRMWLHYKLYCLIEKLQEFADKL